MRLLLTALLALLGLSANVFAKQALRTMDENVCGGKIIVNEDCKGHDHRKWQVSCCDEGYRIQGVIYTDHAESDSVDTLSAMCRSVAKGNTDIDNRDFGRENRVKITCNNNEILTGVVWKDRVTKAQGQIDSMDSVVPVCVNPATGARRVLSSSDFQNGGGALHKAEVNLPRRVIGIASKERLGDTTDCAAVVVK
ncbi:MAG TPA: hypothetical protein DDW49_09070 [Deltaproteobacteria bacterium]|nr:hypothetical protein [Deltaproteobacteria bacterium]